MQLSLGGGLPNAQLFPFQSVQAKLKTGETIELEGHHLDLALQYSPSVSSTILLLIQAVPNICASD